MGFMGYDIDIPYDLPYYTVCIYIYYLVVGLEHLDYLSIQLGISSSHLTFILFRGVETTNQHL